MSKNDLTLESFLDDAKSDVIQVTQYFLEFFIDREFMDLINDFRNNLSEFIYSIMDLKEIIPKSRKELYKKFVQHGLTGDELQRKLSLFYVSREIFQDTKLEFINSFQTFIKEWKQTLDEPVNFEKLNTIPNILKKVYNKTRDILKRLKKVTLRHFDIIKIYLKSLVSVVGVGGLATEFKDTIEAVMKSREEKTPSLGKTIKRYGANILLNQISNAI